jgi:hypothetical protein
VIDIVTLGNSLAANLRRRGAAVHALWAIEEIANVLCECEAGTCTIVEPVKQCHLDGFVRVDVTPTVRLVLVGGHYTIIKTVLRCVSHAIRRP